MPKIFHNVAHLWWVVTGRIPTPPYQCNNPACGATVRHLTGGQYSRWTASRTMPCRKCRAGYLEDVQAVSS